MELNHPYTPDFLHEVPCNILWEINKTQIQCNVKKRENIFLDQSLWSDLHQKLIGSILGLVPSSSKV